MTDLQMANMLADYHKECEAAETLREKADIQLKHARLILAALRQPLVSGRSEQLFCECKRNNPYTGVKFDFTLRCFDCNKIIEQNNCH